MKRFSLLLICAVAFVSSMAQSQPAADEQHKTHYLTTEDFQKKVFDYKASKEWKYVGERPCLIDFYATWCGPCKAVAPILETLAGEYEGRVDIYKVDVDKEKELAALFGIRSIPTMLYVPVGQQPTFTQGGMPKEALTELIDVILLGQKPKNLKMWQSEEAQE